MHVALRLCAVLRIAPPPHQSVSQLGSYGSTVRSNVARLSVGETSVKVWPGSSRDYTKMDAFSTTSDIILDVLVNAVFVLPGDDTPLIFAAPDAW